MSLLMTIYHLADPEITS